MTDTRTAWRRDFVLAAKWRHTTGMKVTFFKASKPPNRKASLSCPEMRWPWSEVEIYPFENIGNGLGPRTRAPGRSDDLWVSQGF